MKQLVILSGKGGTGKTAVAAAFTHLAHTDPALCGTVAVDADVDAANLELLLDPRLLRSERFLSGSVATVNPERCIGCGVCTEVCRFGAIRVSLITGISEVDAIACEGCAACYYQCPSKAIGLAPQLAGDWYESRTRFGHLFHARLRAAQENSGKLVTLVREKGRLATVRREHSLMIVDGPPGIACPAIAAVTGADLALVVTEPTVAGIHDLERVVGMIRHFRVRALVCVNKGDLNPKGVASIEDHCRRWETDMIGSIPFDESVTSAMVRRLPVTAYRPEAPASLSLVRLWERVKQHLAEPGERSTDVITAVPTPQESGLVQLSVAEELK